MVVRKFLYYPQSIHEFGKRNFMRAIQMRHIAAVTVLVIFVVVPLFLVSMSSAFSTSIVDTPLCKKNCNVGCNSHGCTTEWIVTCGTTNTPIPGARVYYTQRIRTPATTDAKGTVKVFEAVRSNQQLVYSVFYPASFGGGSTGNVNYFPGHVIKVNKASC